MSSGIFEQKSIYQFPPNSKPTAIQTSENTLVYADERGNVTRFSLNGTNLSGESTKQLFKYKVEQIKHIRQNLFLIFSEGTLYLLDSSIPKIESTIRDKIGCFTLNKNNSELIMISKKFIGIMATFINNKFENFREKVFVLPDIPITLTSIQNYIYYGYKGKEYYYMNLEDTNITINPLNIPMSQYPLIKATDVDEIVVTGPENLGIFITKQGTPKPKNNLFFQNKQILDINNNKQFIIVLFENLIQIFQAGDSKKIQDIPASSSSINRCIASSSSIFFANQTDIIYVQSQNAANSIRKYLQEGKPKEAQQIFFQNKTDSASVESFNLDCAWVFLLQMNFNEALKLFTSTNVDVRELLIIFPEFIPTQKKISNELSQKETISIVINRYLSNNLKSQQQQDQQNQLLEFKDKAKEFLIQFLESKRQDFIKMNPKDVPTFSKSEYAINKINFDRNTYEQLLEFMDFVLFKVYLDRAKFDKLRQLFQQQKIYCKDLYADLQIPFEKNQIFKETNQDVLARFFESFDKIDKSLEIWRKMGESAIEKVSKEGCEECIEILKKHCSKERISNNIGWLLKKLPKGVLNLLENIDTEQFNPDAVLQLLQQYEVDDPALCQQLRLKYLETIVLKHNIDQERFHTQLAFSYIDAIFQIIPKNTPSLKDSNSNETLKNLQSKLLSFLRNPNAKYNATFVLEQKLKDSWMLIEEIELYKREKRHDDALQKLIKLNEFDWAELYCAESNENLLTKVFKKYFESYNYIREKIKNGTQNPKDQEFERMIKTRINNFLKKYPTHPQVNPVEVLQMVPENWQLNEQEGLNVFLQLSLSETLHQRRAYRSARFVSEMDVLNLDCQCIKAKKSFVKINPDKKCINCHKQIGDKIFAVFPNAVVTDLSCIKSNSVCPYTKRNFELHFKF